MTIYDNIKTYTESEAKKDKKRGSYCQLLSVKKGGFTDNMRGVFYIVSKNGFSTILSVGFL